MLFIFIVPVYSHSYGSRFDDFDIPFVECYACDDYAGDNKNCTIIAELENASEYQDIHVTECQGLCFTIVDQAETEFKHLGRGCLNFPADLNWFSDFWSVGKKLHEMEFSQLENEFIRCKKDQFGKQCLQLSKFGKLPF